MLARSRERARPKGGANTADLCRTITPMEVASGLEHEPPEREGLQNLRGAKAKARRVDQPEKSDARQAGAKAKGSG